MPQIHERLFAPDKDTGSGSELRKDSTFRRRVVPYLDQFIAEIQTVKNESDWPNSLGNFVKNTTLVKALGLGKETSLFLRDAVERGVINVEGSFNEDHAFTVAVTVAAAIYGGKNGSPLNKKGAVDWEAVLAKREEYAIRVREHYADESKIPISERGKAKKEEAVELQKMRTTDAEEKGASNVVSETSEPEALDRDALIFAFNEAVHPIQEEIWMQQQLTDEQWLEEELWLENELRIEAGMRDLAQLLAGRAINLERDGIRKEKEEKRRQQEAGIKEHGEIKVKEGRLLRQYSIRAFEEDKLSSAARFLASQVRANRKSIDEAGLTRVRELHRALIEQGISIGHVSIDDIRLIQAAVLIERTLERGLRNVETNDIKKMKESELKRGLEKLLRHMGDPDFTKEGDVILDQIGVFLNAIGLK